MPFDHMHTQLCHVLPQLHMLEFIIGKGRQAHKLRLSDMQVMDARNSTSACMQGMYSREL